MGTYPSAKYYCGNNELNKSGKPTGSNNKCLRIGFNKGRHLPCDLAYNGAYKSIDGRKIWCGNSKQLPSGYDLKGSPSICLQKGVGLGKADRARRGCKSPKKILIYVSVWVSLTLGVFLGLFFGKPGLVTAKNTQGIDQLDGGKLTLYTIIFSSIIGIVIWLISLKVK